MRALLPGLILLAAAGLEVGGDAIVRRGLRGGGWAVIALGCLALGLYGIVVNTVPVDFSKLLGVYVAVFAVVSVLVGKFYFAETIPTATWLGLAIIVVGGLVIQFGEAVSSK